jgi:hypothetical protein
MSMDDYYQPRKPKTCAYLNICSRARSGYCDDCGNNPEAR